MKVVRDPKDHKDNKKILKCLEWLLKVMKILWGCSSYPGSHNLGTLWPLTWTPFSNILFQLCLRYNTCISNHYLLGYIICPTIMYSTLELYLQCPLWHSQKRPKLRWHVLPCLCWKVVRGSTHSSGVTYQPWPKKAQKKSTMASRNAEKLAQAGSLKPLSHCGDSLENICKASIRHYGIEDTLRKDGGGGESNQLIRIYHN